MSRSALIEAVALLVDRVDLSPELSCTAVTEIMDGQADPVHIAAFLTALRVKGEVADELSGAVMAVRSRMTRLAVPDSLRPVLDTCGTGGDGHNTVNISTATAIVVASCGVRVAKHGNRSASGNSGSAEVLTELGVNITPSHENLIQCLAEVGIAFLFAPSFHPALRHAAAVRKQLPFRTLFNLVGPLVNPASPEFQLLGTPDRDRAQMMASALSLLNDLEQGDRKAYVIAGGAGLDEVSLHGVNVVEVVDGPGQHPVEFWEPQDFGLKSTAHDALRVSGPAESAARILSMLRGEAGATRALVLANSAAALRLVGLASSLPAGVDLAAAAIDDGRALKTLERWADLSNQA